MKHTAIIRADAGPEMGGGHIQRCRAFADALAGQGWQCLFASRAPTTDTVPSLADSAHGIIQLSGARDDEINEIASAFKGHCDVLVTDHYGLGEGFETDARRIAQCVLALDDRPTRRHDCDLLLDPTPGRSSRDYAPFVPERCGFMLGAEFALLRGQFAEARPGTLARREAQVVPERLLVTLGTTDPANATATVLDGVARRSHDLAVDVVLGSRAPHRVIVAEMAKGMGARLHLDVQGMAGLMSKADIAIGACGSTMFERCCLGLPGIAIVTADNQRHLADAFHDASATEVVDVSEATVSWITGALDSFCSDPDRLTEMSRAAAVLCDGRGAERVVQRLNEKVTN